MDNLGQDIRNKREKKKMTVEELSKKTLISPAVIRDIEEGKFDRYEGDEAYVKMYLKKISQVLDLDSDGLTQQYIALTKEIELEKIREKEFEIDNQEEVVEKGKKFNFKSPQLTRKPSVYEDHSNLTIIRGAIILVIVCLIVFVFWYGFSMTKGSSHDTVQHPEQSTVEGDVDTKKDDTQQNPQKDETSNQPTTQNEKVAFKKNADFDYSFTLPEGTEEFTFKVEFTKASWSKMSVNGKTYNQFEAKTYNPNNKKDAESVELTFKVSEFTNLELLNGYSMGQHYYINDQEIPLEDSDMSSGVKTFHLKLDK